MSLADKFTALARALTENSYHYVSAVIAAGGSGSRMQSGTTKQFMELDGKPVIINTLLAFDKSEYIDEIVIVAKEDEVAMYPHLIKKYGLKKVTKVVGGSDTRQKSVLNGLSAISDKADFIAIHDGARPLITGEQIKKVVLNAFEFRAAAAASKSKDTPKLVSNNGFIEKGVDRDTLWLMQTPQIFSANLYRAAAYTAIESGYEATDDCALAERAGFPVKVVDCGYENIKITTPEDLKFAELILSERKKQDE